METYEFNITDKEQTGMRVDKLLPELNRIGLVTRYKIGLKQV